MDSKLETNMEVNKHDELYNMNPLSKVNIACLWIRNLMLFMHQNFSYDLIM
jgi:hypothetical protein